MRRLSRYGLISVFVLSLVPMVGTAEAPANEHFERTWARTDLPVAEGDAVRTWMWGPDAFTEALSEPYSEASGGSRTVQYYDKSRMEITDPSADPNSIWYVTNGLLVVEMITGRMQVGNNDFVDREPADVNIAGDADDPNSPTYAALAKRLDDEPTPVFSIVTATIDGDGNLSFSDTFGEQFNVTSAHYVAETNHSIPTVFWDFMNSSGTVYSEGAYQQAPLFENPFFATGLPITEAYWTVIEVGGTLNQVLLQCFERRCLTFTPANDPAWQVEAGNVGQHYHAWRYGGDQPPPTEPPDSGSVELECVALGYPCSLSEMSDEALDLMFDYGETMAEMMGNGTSIPELLDWIRQQPGVVDAIGDDVAIRYRVEGARPAWVYDTGASSASELGQPATVALTRLEPKHHPHSIAPHNVVGKDRDGDGMTDEKPKRALVLAPYLWEFAPYDASPDIAQMLGNARGYENNVHYFANQSAGDQNVLISHFSNWSDYDVVYISSHGSEMCSSDQLFGCDSGIYTGVKLTRESSANLDAIGGSAGFTSTRSGSVVVTNDFFRNAYGISGVENTIIYIDSCESYERSDLWDSSGTLPDLLSGFSSLVFGWERSVDSDHAANTARMLFEDAINEGTPMGKSFTDFHSDIVNDGSDDATLRVTTAEGLDGEPTDLRIREILTILDPITEEPLEDGDPIPIIGALGDGKHDQFSLNVKVDGVDADPGEFVVHVRVNGQDLPETYTLADGEHVGGGFGGALTGAGEYELTDKTVSFGRDVQKGEAFEVTIWVELPEGGESKQTLNSPLKNPTLVFESTIKTSASDLNGESKVRAEMPLVLNADLDDIEPETYDLDYMSYELEISGAPCTYTTTLRDGTIDVVDAKFPTHSETGKIESFVPEFVVLRINPDTSATLIANCPSGPVTVLEEDIHWFAGFVVVYESDFDQEKLGYDFSDWDEGSGDVYAKSIVNKSANAGEVTVTGELEMELVKP